MEDRRKAYIKLNIISLFFAGISFISVTLAWFAYSGFTSGNLDVDIKAWYIEFDGGNTESNEIIMSLSDLAPGMETKTESLTIKNKGDSFAKLSYVIESVRILDKELEVNENNQSEITDALSNDYPFNIDISISKKYLEPSTGEATLDLSLSWPLDTANDEDDSLWGNKAYDFIENETKKHDEDNDYHARTSIKVVIAIKAEQNMDKVILNQGDLVLFNPKNNELCSSITEENCLITNVISTNYMDDDYLFMLPNLLDDYGETEYEYIENLYVTNKDGFITETEPLSLSHIINLVSTDVHNTLLVRDKYNLSNTIVGNVRYENRLEDFITNKVTKYDGYIKFDRTKFDFIKINKCYWLNQDYKDNYAFALVEEGRELRIAPLDKSKKCSVAPVLKIQKSALETEDLL